MKTINERLAKELLQKKGLTTYRIAKDSGYIVQTVDNWLKGKDGRVVSIPAEAVAELCVKYSLDISYIMFGVKTKIKSK